MIQNGIYHTVPKLGTDIENALCDSITKLEFVSNKIWM